MGMFEPYEKTEPFRAEPRRAIKFAAATLTTAGYRIIQQSESFLRAEASRTTDWNRCQMLLRNVVAIELRASGSVMSARVELADFPVLQRGLNVVVAAVLLLVFYHVAASGKRPMPDQFRHVFLAMAGVFLVITLASSFGGVGHWKRQAYRTADSFLHNVVLASSIPGITS